MKKLVILRGRPTSGKTTALRKLMTLRAMRDWTIIEHSAIKKKLGKQKGKKRLHELLKKAMLAGKNILTEETSRETLNKYIGKEIKRYKYRLIVFQFWVSTAIAYKRDVKRSKEKMHALMGRKLIEKMHKMHDERQDKKAIIINTDKLTKRQVINQILKRIT